MTNITHGFALLREQEIPELRTRARLLRHVRTGAELLSLENDDENKCFGVAFRTPPADHTGVAHILEHAVLCGSRRYPLKDPFVELLKGSLNTFLNAFTFPDKTCYPVASQNVQDFRNLVNVYLDTVFYPRLERETFLQQGWHYEIAEEGGGEENDGLSLREAELRFKGVVFNEMKGARSSPDGLLYDHTRRAIFPDSTYGLDSGGSPKHIPDLTYEQLRDFHRRYYHPSNARIFFHGDDDPEERLRLLDAWLRDFEPLPPESDIRLQTPFDAPRRLVHPYPVSADERDPRAYVVVGWLIGESPDAETALALRILDHLLIGTPASPLRKALIDSGLGEDLAGDGFSGELRQNSFTTGLRNVAEADAERVEALILGTLGDLAERGIDPEAVEASLNTVEFALRENNTGGFPRGLSLMLRALTTWLHDDDPLALLAFEAPLKAVRARAHSEPYFESLIRSRFLLNPHRVSVILRPDPDLARREAEAERARLREARQAMSEADLQTVAEEQRRLQERQQTPDPPEALATLPTLALADLDRENKIIPLAALPAEGHAEALLYHDLWTSGILYLDLGFDLHRVPADLLPYAALFGRSLVQIGTERADFVRLTQRILQKTGGIRPQIWNGFVPGRDAAAARLFLRAKAMPSQAGDLLAILGDILREVRLDNRERFHQMALEEKAGMESRLIPAGSGFVAGRLYAHFHEAAWAGERMGGIAYLFFLRELVERVERDWPGVLADLYRLRDALLHRGALVVNATVDADNWARFEPALREFLAGLPDAGGAPAAWPPAAWPRNGDRSPAGEGLAIPAQVNYVGKAANLYDLGLPRHGSAVVASKYLRTTYLWQQVRVQGGAYGGSCQFDHRSGLFGLLSYRDPNLLETLDVYDRAGEFLRRAPISERELTRTIIGVIGDLDHYQLPDARGFTSMARWLSGETDADRQRLRDEILGTQVSDLAPFAEALDRIKDAGLVAVLGAQAALDAANAARPGLLPITRVL